MSQPPDDNDELERALRRMEGEFGPRRPREGAEGPGQPGPGPTYGDARPIPTPRVRAQGLPSTRPRAVWAILWAIGLIYVVSCLLSGSLVQPDLPVLILLGAKENTLIAAGDYWRLISATFLHANLIHIFFNGYALFALGPESERIYGTGRFLALYFLAGLGGSVASYLFSPAPSVGASGAIFGLIGGLGIFYYLSRQALGEFGRAQTQSMAAIAMVNLIIGFASAGVIDNWGHLGGLLAGVVAGAALAPRLSVIPDLYPPVIARRFLPWGWAAVLALALILIALVVLLPGAA
ncbi:MAG: rhomboid family intramembrane serine protease [Chloroflexales bacterium]|nr:rhomboid family intramembrane serine protease [Chloroflexales bacterium]